MRELHTHTFDEFPGPFDRQTDRQTTLFIPVGNSHNVVVPSTASFFLSFSDNKTQSALCYTETLLKKT